MTIGTIIISSIFVLDKSYSILKFVQAVASQKG